MFRDGLKARVWILTAVLGVASSADAFAQFGKGGKGGKIPPGYWEKKNRPTGGGSGSDAGVPIDLRGTFELGNKVKAKLPAKGSNLELDFHALKDSSLDLQVTCTGEVGESKVILRRPGRLFDVEFKKSGRKFLLEDHTVTETGKMLLVVQHRGEGALDVSIATGGELPKTLEETLDFTASESAILKVDGWLGRRVTEISLRPMTADAFGTLALHVAGPDRKSILDTEPAELTSARPKLRLDRSLPLPLEDQYYFQFDIDEDASAAFEWKVKLTFDNGALPSGTVVVEPK